MEQISKRKFKNKLGEKTMCGIQHNGWTCGTCFYAISKKLTIDDWNSVLIYRGDYKLEEINKMRLENDEIPLTREMIDKSITKIWKILTK